MQQRKNEIAAKRARLEELKRLREERNREFASSRQSIGVPSEASSARVEDKEDLENLITSLIGNDKRHQSTLSVSTTRSKDDVRDPAPSTPATGGQTEAPTLVSTAATSVAPKTLSFAPLTTVYEIVADSPKKDAITYSKGVQTEDAWTEEEGARTYLDDDDDDMMSKQDQQRREYELRQQLRQEIEREVQAAQRAQADADAEAQLTEARGVKTLKDDETTAVVSSDDFIDFLQRSSKIAERALEEDYNVLADYRRSEQESDIDHMGRGKTGRGLRELIQFYDERWSKKRMITDLDFSPKFSELLLVSYTKSPAAPYDPDGLILVWNQHMQSRPEYRFQANSDILAARFSPFHPSLIVGGTYSGQVLIWDTRSRTADAVQSTPLTMLNSMHNYSADAPRAAGHTSPIYSLTFAGTQSAYSILSTSTDGTICAWVPDMLTQPSERLQLLDPYPKSVFHQATDLAPTCLGLPVASSAESHALIGTEQGGMYLVHRQDRAGGATKAGIDPRILYAGHAAPVMALDFHKAVGPLDLSDLALSAGLDWNIKLWRVREARDVPSATAPASEDILSRHSRSRPGTAQGHNTQSAYTKAFGSANKPEPQPALLEIQKSDAVYDVRWSPARPSVFASVDGSGTVEVWDLNENTDIPAARAWVSERSKDAKRAGATPANTSITNTITSTSTLDAKLAQNTAGPPAGCLGNSLNKCAWEHREGRRLAVGGLDGVLTVFEVGEGLSGRRNAEVSEWEGMRKLVAQRESGRR